MLRSTPHAFALALATAGAVQAQTAPIGPPVITIDGPDELVYDTKRDGCDGYDVPDVPPRAFRDAAGKVRMVALHFDNRLLKGDSLDRLKLDCRVVFRTSGSGVPEAYDDRSWITATWTRDGKSVHGLVHHEYQGNTHPGRCTKKDYLSCWFNTILAVRSDDSGESFMKATTPVVASAPFPQSVGQGRHRGFFNPSNIVTDGVWHYMIAGTTGWDGQNSGACLFRTDDIANPTRWRAFDGIGFETAFVDPYRAKPNPGLACQTVGPFPAPVGSITRHRPSGAWVAVFQASAGGRFPAAGIYAAASKDLKTWSEARLILPTKTLYDDACGAEALNSYPTLLDRTAETRNFEDTGDTPDLYLSRMRIDGCKHTGDRKLIRMRVKIAF
ncbi:MAG TPA: hypothetical protein PK812_11850 [Beijerinckiaceae bacterium]|nr:hypothetical protein [Beijerinckiaceae bacterium]